MQYELIKDSDAGVIVDPTPVLQDMKDTFEVSFILPEEGAYIAVFRAEDNAEYKAVIRNGTVQIPKELLKKQQRVTLTVCLTDGETILHSWACQSLKIGAFLNLRRTQLQITAGADDNEVYARIAQLERSNAELRTALKEEQTQALENFHNEVTDTLSTTLQSFEKQIKEEAEGVLQHLSAEAHKRDCAFLSFAYAAYENSPLLNGKGLSVTEFMTALGFDAADFSAEELGKIKTLQEEL